MNWASKVSIQEREVSVIDRMSVRRRAMTEQEQADLRDINMMADDDVPLSFFTSLAVAFIVFRVLRRKR